MLHCPGADKIRIPDLEIKQCPGCGSEIEIFSNEFQARCEACGFVAYKDLSSCVRWCKYAEECLGTELFQQLQDRAKP
jgi:transposase